MDSLVSLKNFQERQNNQCKRRYYELKQRKKERKNTKSPEINIITGCIQNTDEDHAKSSYIQSDDNLSKKLEERKSNMEPEDEISNKVQNQSNQINPEEEEKFDENNPDQSAKASNLGGMKKAVIRNQKKEKVVKPKLPKIKPLIKKKKRSKKELNNLQVKQEIGHIEDMANLNSNQDTNRLNQADGNVTGMNNVNDQNLTEKGENAQNTEGNVSNLKNESYAEN
jgi:hypothetical protein